MGHNLVYLMVALFLALKPYISKGLTICATIRIFSFYCLFEFSTKLVFAVEITWYKGFLRMILLDLITFFDNTILLFFYSYYF